MEPYKDKWMSFYVLEGLKLNGKHHNLVYVNDANSLLGSINTVKKNRRASESTNKKIGLEANTEKTKCINISRDQNEGKIETRREVTKPLKGRNSSNI